MQTSKHCNLSILATFALIIAAGSVVGQMEIMRSTADGGGTIHSTGGNFELSGTIGQPDAGAMAGGAFELTGGFWFALAPTDCNEDGSVNLIDHAALTMCLHGPSGGVVAGCACYDTSRNGAVDLHDFANAQVVFSGS